MTGINRSQNLIFILITLTFLGVLTVACRPSSQSVIRLYPAFGDTLFRCGNSVEPEAESTPFQLKEFALFVSQISINNQRVSLQAANDYNVGFLGGPCHASPQWNLSLETNIERGDTLAFTIGLPFALNHQLPLKQEWPLNNSSMFWSWQTGYKFLRLDLAQPDAWSFHLGSTGCSSQSSLRAPDIACNQPNLLSVTLADFQPDKPILFDLQPLLEGIDFNQHRSCLSQSDRASCQRLFANFDNKVVVRQ